jgi:autotransporter-associated beta strand protein
MSAGPAQAQSYTWGGTTTTTDYNLGTNWANPPAGAPPIAGGQSAVFDTTGSATVSVTAGPIAPDSWTFTAASKSYSISGADVNFGLAGSSGGIINNGSAGQISISNNIGESNPGVQVQQLGASTLILSGSNSYSGGTTISAGTLIAAHASGGVIDALGAGGGVLLDGGTLRAGVDGILSSAIIFNDNKTSTFSPGTQTVTVNAPITLNSNSVARFGKSGDTGTLVLSGGGTADSTSAVVIAGGTVRDGGNASITSLTFSAGSTTVSAGATLDFNDSFNQAIHNLKGGGNVVTGTVGGTTLSLFASTAPPVRRSRGRSAVRAAF